VGNLSMGSLVPPLRPCYLVPRRQGEKHVMARRPSDEVQLKLRFDEKLRRRLAREAERKDRSMNAEIVLRLESSFRQEDTKQLFERALAAIVQDVQNIKEQAERLTAPAPTTLVELGPAPAPIVIDVREVKEMLKTFLEQSANRGKNPK
jgi:hypothetical protein